MGSVENVPDSAALGVASTDLLVPMIAAEEGPERLMQLVNLNVAALPRTTGNQHFDAAFDFAVIQAALLAGLISGAALNRRVATLSA